MIDRRGCLHRLHAAAVGALACLTPSIASATADGPDYYQVVDVAMKDVLNLRASPTAAGTVIGTILPNSDGIANFGCVGGLTIAEYEAATDSERAAARKTRWCKVGYDHNIGWAAGWFLAEGRDEDAFGGGSLLGTLADSEWQVRDFAGEPASAEAWIAFRTDGTVTGFGGCNRFNGGYTQDGRTLHFSPLSATRMACPEVQTRVEQNLFGALDGSRDTVATQLLLALFDETGTLVATLTRRESK